MANVWKPLQALIYTYIHTHAHTCINTYTQAYICMYAYSDSGNWENVLLTSWREWDRKSGLTKTENAAKMEINDTPSFQA